MSTQTKHTPGPWEMWNSHGSRIMRNWRVGERHTCEGVVRPVAIISDVDVQRSPEEAAANAQLIVTAPDLLAALIECEAAIAALIKEKPMMAAKLAGSTTLGNHAAEARAVIRKATGS